MKNKHKVYIAWAKGLAVGLAFVGAGAFAYSGSSPKVLVEGNYMEAAQPAAQETLGGQFQQYTNQFADGIVVEKSLVRKGRLDQNFSISLVDIKTWPSDTSTVYVPNPTFGLASAATSSVQAKFDISGNTPSSTFRLFCGSSVTPFAAYNTATPPANLINGAVFTTGTQSVAESFATSTLVGPGQGVLCQVKHGVAGNDCSGSGTVCENVTSTNRGWQAKLKITWEMLKSTQQ